MKKHLLFICILFIAAFSKAQTGDSCTTAKNFATPQPIEPDESQIIQTQWFAFTATDVQLRITLLNRVNANADKANQIFLWSGSCGSLTLLGSDTLSGGSDSVLSITVGSIVNGATYYFQVNKSTNTDSINYFVDRRYKLLDPTCTLCGPPPIACQLICNGSFEANTGDPTIVTGGEINLACAWDRPTLNTPDYYDPLGTANYDVPGAPNFAGQPATPEPAFTGNSYAGFFARTGGMANWHEYIYQQLQCPLIAGVTYNMSFWVKRAQPFRSPGNVTNIGAWFTNAAGIAGVAGLTSTIPVVPQVLNAVPLVATAWTQITQNFVAGANQTFVVIGNFDSPLGPGANAYYLLDEVSLTPVTNTITVTATPNPVCSGATATLTNSLGASLDWTPAAGLSCTPCVSPTTPPITSSTTFTGTLTFCTGCTISGSTTVNVAPTSTVNPLPNLKVCCGTVVGPINFTGTPAGVTFSWTNSDPTIGLAASGAGNILAFTATNSSGAPVTATITVTPSISGCAGTPTTFIITVFPCPVITVTPPSATIALGSSVVLTASGAATYTWSPTTGLSNPNISNPTASPGVTTTYTVTGTNQYGCSSTATVTVTVTYPNCGITTINVPNGTVASSPAGLLLFPGVSSFNVNYKIQGTLIMDRSYNFIGCNLLMEASGATVPNIQVVSNRTLQLTQQTHLFSCTSMWDGIYITSGSKIITQGSCIIEDAQQAVNIPQGALVCTFDQTIFNKNLYSIKLTTNNSTTSPIAVTNSIFTCRYIPTFPVASSNPTIGVIQANLNLSTPTLVPAVLRSPFSVQKGFAGIYATDVRTLNVGDASAAGYKNIFDAIMIGIRVLNPTKPNTSATIYNNQFQYLLGYAIAPCMLCPNSSGYGVNATGPNSSASNTITIGGTASNQANSFKNIYGAIFVRNYKTNNITGNNITNTSTGPFSISVVNYGNQGIFVLPALGSTVFIANQSLIKNCANAIWVNHAAGAINPSILQIDNNGSAGSPCITADPSGYCTNGIMVTDLISTTTLPSMWSISGNFITEANNCIFVSNVRKPSASTIPFNIFSNSCRTRYVSTTLLSGIKLTGCKGLNVTENHTNYTPGSMAYVLGGNLQAYGLFMQNSTNMTIKCNLFEDAARSMTFDGTCSSSTTAGFGITQNTMRRAQDGLVLLSASTVIGQQGSFLFGSNNFWDMSAGGAPNFINQTWSASSTTNTASKLFVSNVTAGAFTTKPLVNFGGGPYIIGTGINNALIAPAACSGTPPPALATGSSSMTSADILSYTNDLQTIEEDTTVFPIYDNESHWQHQKFTYDEVDDNPPYTVNHPLLVFHNTHTGSAFDKFVKVDHKIEMGNFVAANAINNTITPANIVESNQQTVNTQILLQLITPSYTYTTSDIATLYSIANQCPLQGGNAVYQARILLMMIAENVIEFDDNCDYKTERAMQTIPTVVEEQIKPFKLYPNPNNGTMLIDYSLNAMDKAEIKIYDITGKFISSYLLDNASNEMQLHDDLLNNGIYFYQIRVNDRLVQADKLIIIK